MDPLRARHIVNIRNRKPREFLMLSGFLLGFGFGLDLFFSLSDVDFVFPEFWRVCVVHVYFYAFYT